MAERTESVGERSIGELLAVLAQQAGTLLRQEMRLASAELALKGKALLNSSTVMVVGFAVTVLGGVALVVAAIGALALVLPLWAAALIVGGILAGAGLAMVAAGLTALRRFQPLPTATLRTLRDDLVWAKGRLQ